MYKLCFFVPVSHVEEVKEAVFNAGAGRIGTYDKCSWQVQGRGQFRPLQGSEPYLGTVGEIEHVDEYRVEMVCRDDLIQKALRALKEAHPYEAPAYDVWKLDDV